jgi:uncharacterized protein YebE (UPF0316 family)
MTFDALMTALVIFVLRVVNNGIGTVRLIAVTRDLRLLSAALGALEAFIFAVVISSVVQDLTNVPNMVAYCGGFAVGGYMGMALEARFITSYLVATIITHTHGHEIAVALRERGFGVTETLGEGRDGSVTMLRCVAPRRDAQDILKAVRAIHPDAFISIEEARAVQHGWMRQMRVYPNR